MNKRYGTCKLTGKKGTFVDAHILPKALTKPYPSGESLLQPTKGKGYKKRFSSWYDKRLVIQEGESILEKIDDKGIKALRKEMLVWSSWKVFKPSFPRLSGAFPDHSVRTLKISNPEAIHAFFVSIAWRACASSMHDMRRAYAEAEDIELMRRALVSERALAPNFYPVSLTQLSTVGEAHNVSPVRETVTTEALFADTMPENSYEVIRIYLDGLVAHVHLDSNKAIAIDNPMFVNSADETLVTCVKFEASAEYQHLMVGLWEAYEPFGTFRKLRRI